MLNHFILLITILTVLYSCASVPPNTHKKADRIATGAGPEDMLLDTISCNKARLLVSCNDHRLGDKAPQGDIYSIEFGADSLTSSKLTRTGEPNRLDFHPHGFDLIRQNGKVYLFVVSHNEKEFKHSVYKYEVSQHKLKYVATYEHPLMNSPNTVVALRGGGFYVSIDQGKRGDRLASFLRAKTGSIVFCDEKGGWARVANKLAYPNGLYISPKERYLYASTTRQHQIFKYTLKLDGNLINKEKVAKVVGGDNLRLGQNKELLIPAHSKIFKFVGHFKDSTKLSPSIVYGVHTHNGKKELIYSSDGQQISAASTAIQYNGYIYISQVFQPYVLRVKK
jgi:hypothetical protein